MHALVGKGLGDDLTMRDSLVEGFVEFFRSIHGYEPYPWQRRLSEKVLEDGKWPDAIDIPTGCGKTSCIDIAVYALAMNPHCNPRRIVYVVNRRVIVDEANKRAERIKDKLDEAKDGILLKVKKKLLDLSDGSTTLDSTVLRGGTHIDRDWNSNPSQPMIISSTVDQAGSRLLFRGYGVSRKFSHIDAGLLGNDCLWILDETHISRPFTDTLRQISRLRRKPWLNKDLQRPWGVVEMTATPATDSGIRHGLSDEDLENDHIKKKLDAPKPCTLVESTAEDSNDHERLADDLEKKAAELINTQSIRSVAVICNRVKTAIEAYDKLKNRAHCDVHLMIGRMRPIDRDVLYDQLKHLKTGSAEKKGDETPKTIVVTTQCLEVGADLDFDGMVTEAASLDALRQRFGRMNRAGENPHSQGVIIIPKCERQSKHEDPIYLDRIAKTWKFLKDHTKTEKGAKRKNIIDFGYHRFRQIEPEREELREMILAGDRGSDILPAHMDLLSQTSTMLSLDPPVDPFLHGLGRGVPTVSVVWRYGWEKKWAGLINAMPPRSTECVQVPIWEIKRHLATFGRSGKHDVSHGDTEWERVNTQYTEQYGVHGNDSGIRACVWRGKSSKDPYTEVKDVKDIRPNDVIILPADTIDEAGFLAHIPCTETPRDRDVAEQAAYHSTRRVTIRIGSVFSGTVDKQAEDVAIAKQEGHPMSEQKKLEYSLLESINDRIQSIMEVDDLELDSVEYRVELVQWENDWVLIVKVWEKSPTRGGEKELLDEHCQDVSKRVGNHARRLGLPEDVVEVLEHAGINHDVGKAYTKFQNMLYRSEIHRPELRAKDVDGKKINPFKYYRKGFRHELVSSRMAESRELYKKDSDDEDLFLHLIESHHGHCRPFVPTWTAHNDEKVVHRNMTAHVDTKLEQVGSGASARFWRCVRRYGWWGLAWLEALFVLSDWESSRA